jgi:PAS domain S-box-containing protein
VPTGQPLEDTRELLGRAQAAVEAKAQNFRILLYLASLLLLIIAIRLGLWLRARTLKIRRLVDANIIGVFIFALEGRIIEANEAFLQMVGYDRDDVASGRLHWTDLAPPEWRDRDERAWPAQLEIARSLQPFETEYIRKDGSRVPVLFGAAAIEDGGKQGVAFVLDLTERKRSEAEARESERRYREAQMELAHANRVATMGQLTASIAHEVAQPVAAALASAEVALRWLARSPADLEEVRQSLARIVKDGRRASDVIGRIRQLIKKAPPRKDRLQVNGTIREVIDLTRGEAVKNGVSVRMELAGSLPLVEADPVEMQQVILNLIINAVEAMKAVREGERELYISTRLAEPEGVLVAVQDSGPGLLPATLERAFDAFYTTKPGGLGMGLSICRSIIEAHQGRLSAGANTPRGAIFEFSLPACSAAEPRDP